MKILHISPTYYPATYWGGPIFSVYALNNALAQLPGVRLRVLTTDAAGPSVSSRLDGAKLTGLFPNQEVMMARRFAAGSVSFELLRKLPSLVRWADVVHLTATYSFPTIPTLMFCRLMNKPVVWSHRGAILDAYQWPDVPRKRLKRLWELLCNVLIRQGRVVAHVTSDEEENAARVRIPNAAPVLVPNAVEVPDGLPERDWMPDSKLRIMYLGRIAPKKGIENLLEAMSHLKEQDIVLTIYGAGDADFVSSLKACASDKGLAGDNVFFAGHVDGIEKQRAFLSADVCVVPSHSENFCMVVAEALAHGLPVIASRGTPWSQIERHNCGLWVENSPESLAQAIDRIRTMKLERMGRQGRTWMKEAFSWQAAATRMMAVYQAIQ